MQQKYSKLWTMTMFPACTLQYGSSPTSFSLVTASTTGHQKPSGITSDSSAYTWCRHQYRLQTCLYQALIVAPADVASQAHLTSMGPGFVWDAAPLLGFLTEDDRQELLGDPDAVGAWLRCQHQLPETKQPAGLPADLRSTRDLCDLLLNIPLLSRALRESVPAVWEYHQINMMNLTRSYSTLELESYEEYHGKCLDRALTWKDLAFDFQIKLGMDRQTALRAACRIGVELRRLLDDPETAREYERRRRRFPDPWGVLPFWLRRPV
ncbi:hypothetical protein FJT64_024533 [Amphibalanus amphitrite]|uniref:Uncharacterized protein n=1 Tax=Amphibalanus amphitrite TaxID=1232801 RepID=A0A6A4WE67_AMPAM|nr:hypothetical protein FJT64_024533 [Amphibalanus amphitrite]